MRELPVELDESTLEALEVERRLTGFDSRAAYVRWIVERRGSISDESDAGTQLLEAYRRRIAALERRLEGETEAEPEGETRAGATSSKTREREREREPSEDDSRGSDGGDENENQNATASGDASRESEHTDEWRRWKDDPTIEVRGRPRTTVHREREREQVADRVLESNSGAGATNDRDRPGTEVDDARADCDGTDRRCGAAVGLPGTERDEGDRTTPLEPERIVRIHEDPVAADADVLETVEGGRLDELSRRAVAKTRRRLRRDVETGLEYRSTPPFASDDVRPGEDLVDLESLSVPGRSEQRIAQRRAVAGRAIAFLRDETTVRRADVVEHLYEEYPVGYATAEGWWSFLKSVFKQVDAIEDGDETRVWRYVE